MTSLRTGFLGLILGLSLVSTANAATTLMEANDWKVQIGGFLETDLIMDSTRSFNETVGNNPVALPGTANGENGRTAMSARHSRLSFTITPPVQDDWKSKGYLEMDFMGYQPNANAAAAPSVSEATFYQNPSLRFRHAYFSAERNGWSYLVGQGWSLFGWQPTYVVTTLAPSPGPGILYARAPQFTVIKTMAGDTNTWQAGLSIARPAQRDSNMPNIDLGVRWALTGYKSGFGTSTSDQKVESLSVGLSGTFRQFVTADTNATNSALSKTNGSAVAVNALIPIIPATEKDPSNTLTLTAEYSAGSGYNDQLSNSGLGLTTFNGSGSSRANQVSLDGGYGNFNGADFELTKLQSTAAQLQYHFATETPTFVTLGYSELSSSNAKDLGATYDKTKMVNANIFHDLTKQIRVGFEYAKYTTTYTLAGDAQERSPENNRYMLAGYFRF